MNNLSNQIARLGQRGRRICATAFIAAAGLFGLPQLASAAICPVTANTNTDCAFIITIGAGNVITGTAVPNANPYDGSDDSLIGIVNATGATYTGSFTLSGTGDGGGIFGFDGDGICTFITCNFPDPTTYEGPMVTFSNISADQATGTINVAGLLSGATTYFSLESSPSSITGGGGIGLPVSAVPEPDSLALLSLGIVLVGFMTKRRKAI